MLPSYYASFIQEIDHRKEFGMTTSLGISQLNLWATGPQDGNPLRQFIAWRKRWRIPGRFAHAHPETTLHRDLSLADNFLLAMGEPPSEVPQAEKAAIVASAIQRHGLTALVRWFGSEQALPSNLSPQQKAVASICCALLNGAEETLIDLSSVKLDELCLNQVRHTLQACQRTIIVVTRDTAAWSDVATRNFNPFEATVDIKKLA